ncbi:MAG: glycosyltransferase, partial [Halobacteriales archaeon]|nr:glycosyltransferase [Halobacteriales archaeon]
VAVRSLAQLDRSDVRLLIAGTGRAEPSLRRLAEDLGIGDRIEFLGYVPEEDLPGLYSSADITLFPPTYEGFGLVFLESMACGTPVVAPAVGGVPDVVTDGVDGCIVEREPKAMADRISELLDDPDRLQKLSSAARETAEEHTWDVTAQAYERLYEGLLETS